MLNLMLLAEPFSFHLLATIVIVICVFAIVFWFLRKVAVPEPFNYVLYAVMALVAIWLLFYLVGQLAPK